MWSVLCGRRRDVWHDTVELAAELRPRPRVRGVENVPTAGACVLLPNHYERPQGVWVGWGAIALTAAIAHHRKTCATIRWVMTSSWEDCYVGPRRIAPEHVHWVLKKLAGLYGIILMSPVPGETKARGRALREVFHALDDTVGDVVALHPEAGGFEELIEPPLGMGRVLASIDRRKVPLLPVAVYEDQGRLCVDIGPAFGAGALCRLGDAQCASEVMVTLASMLPPTMHGPYREAATLRRATAGQTGPA